MERIINGYFKFVELCSDWMMWLGAALFALSLLIILCWIICGIRKDYESMSFATPMGLGAIVYIVAYTLALAWMFA